MVKFANIDGQIRCHEGKIGILKDLSSCFLSLKIILNHDYLHLSPSFIGHFLYLLRKESYTIILEEKDTYSLPSLHRTNYPVWTTE